MQVDSLQCLVTRVDAASATDSASLFNAVNVADSAELLAVAGFIAATAVAAHRIGLIPRWARGEGPSSPLRASGPRRSSSHETFEGAAMSVLLGGKPRPALRS